MKKWRCKVCGYIHEGDAPPETCPVCGVGASEFVLVEDEPAAADADGQDGEPAGKSTVSRLAERLKFVDKVHGHPVSVHIPNGVLPLSFLFLLLAVILKSDAMATAARLNTFFVALAMPVALFTGFVDWLNRYDGKWTRPFAVKVVCGAVATVLVAVLAIWWLVEPDICRGSVGSLAVFVILYVIACGAVGLAGFYGGKLVFRE